MTRGPGTLANGVLGEFKKTDQLIPEEGKGDLREASKRWTVDGEEASNREVRSRNPNNSPRQSIQGLPSVSGEWRKGCRFLSGGPGGIET